VALISLDKHTYPEAVWLCVCGAMRKVAHHLAGYQMHPDERIAHMRARAEAAAQEEENDE